MYRRSFMLSGAAVALSGCAGQWSVAYESGVDASLSKNWHVHPKDVRVSVPSSLTISESNTFAPNADIVWHGEPFGNRRQQVGAIIREGITTGSRALKGPRDVALAVVLSEFHAVTPTAVARAPAAVHNITFSLQAFDAKTGAALTQREVITADLEAYVGSAAIAAAINGQSQRNRIVGHIGRVTQGWLGAGGDQRRTFSSIGR